MAEINTTPFSADELAEAVQFLSRNLEHPLSDRCSTTESMIELAATWLRIKPKRNVKLTMENEICGISPGHVATVTGVAENGDIVWRCMCGVEWAE